MLAGLRIPTDSAQKHAARTNLYLHMNLLVSQASRAEKTSPLCNDLARPPNRPNEHTRDITSQDRQAPVTQFTYSRVAHEE